MACTALLNVSLRLFRFPLLAKMNNVYFRLCKFVNRYMTSRHNVVIKSARISEIDKFVFDQCGS